MNAARGPVARAPAVMTVVSGAAAVAGAQPLAARIAAAEGRVTVQFATRGAACGDGRDFVALGPYLSSGGDYRVTAGGWSRPACVHGPARVTLAVHAGAVTEVRVRVGPGESGEPAGDTGGARARTYLESVVGR